MNMHTTSLSLKQMFLLSSHNDSCCILSVGYTRPHLRTGAGLLSLISVTVHCSVLGSICLCDHSLHTNSASKDTDRKDRDRLSLFRDMTLY